MSECSKCGRMRSSMSDMFVTLPFVWSVALSIVDVDEHRNLFTIIGSVSICLRSSGVWLPVVCVWSWDVSQSASSDTESIYDHRKCSTVNCRCRRASEVYLYVYDHRECDCHLSVYDYEMWVSVRHRTRNLFRIIGSVALSIVCVCLRSSEV